MGLTVGDWVLVDPKELQIVERLQPFAFFQRRAAGTGGQIQPIAANVDTLFIVTSANRDFNIARLERYLAIAHDAGAFPLIVITKADISESPQDFVAAARKLSPGVLVDRHPVPGKLTFADGRIKLKPKIFFRISLYRGS